MTTNNFTALDAEILKKLFINSDSLGIEISTFSTSFVPVSALFSIVNRNGQSCWMAVQCSYHLTLHSFCTSEAFLLYRQREELGGWRCTTGHSRASQLILYRSLILCRWQLVIHMVATIQYYSVAKFTPMKPISSVQNEVSVLDIFSLGAEDC